MIEEAPGWGWGRREGGIQKGGGTVFCSGRGLAEDSELGAIAFGMTVNMSSQRMCGQKFAIPVKIPRNGLTKDRSQKRSSHRSLKSSGETAAIMTADMTCITMSWPERLPLTVC